MVTGNDQRFDGEPIFDEEDEWIRFAEDYQEDFERECCENLDERVEQGLPDTCNDITDWQ